MNEFLSWLAENRLSSWYFLTLENIFYYKDGFKIEEFCDYLKKVNPIEENPFQLQCDNNTWLATEETILRPRIPIDWCSISDDWDRFRKTL
jgi:hypothetical protein